jgi:PIN domain nuclease of toxin-antitoxin system
MLDGDAVHRPVLMPHRPRAAVAAPNNRVFVSAVTTWEIAIKHALGRLKIGTLNLLPS